MKLQAQRPLHYHIMVWLLFCLTGLLLMAGVASAQNVESPTSSITIDAQATAQAPWKAGEKVPSSDTYANMGWLGMYDVYRVFLGVTPQGYYAVQDFYADNNAKLTDPYMVRNESDVEENSYDSRDMAVEGLFITWYPNGQKSMEGRAVNGKEEGEWRLWHPNGQLASISFYVHGKRNGWEEGWSESGTMTKRCHFKEGSLDGVCTMWFDNGNKSEEATFSSDRSVGLESWWHDNGQLQIQGSRDEHSNRQGEWREWDRNGNLMRQSWYEDDKEVRREEHNVPAQQ